MTTSLGLGTGDFLPGYDLHLNSMLGEVDLHHVPLVAGERMESMMAPSLAFDRDGLALAIGSAGGTRLRTALVGVAAAVLDEGLAPAEAVERPRFHPVGSLVHAEPGVDEDALERLESAGRAVRRWPAQHHYFGGVSLVARTGAAGDPRRSGHAAAPPLTLSRRANGGARPLDVAGDLLDQLGLAPEDLLVAEPLPDLDHEPLAVEVALEVEQVRLDPPLAAAVVRIRADRDRRPMGWPRPSAGRRPRRSRTAARAAPDRGRGWRSG